MALLPEGDAEPQSKQPTPSSSSVTIKIPEWLGRLDRCELNSLLDQQDPNRIPPVIALATELRFKLPNQTRALLEDPCSRESLEVLREFAPDLSIGDRLRALALADPALCESAVDRPLTAARILAPLDAALYRFVINNPAESTELTSNPKRLYDRLNAVADRVLDSEAAEPQIKRAVRLQIFGIIAQAAVFDSLSPAAQRDPAFFADSMLHMREKDRLSTNLSAIGSPAGSIRLETPAIKGEVQIDRMFPAFVCRFGEADAELFDSAEAVGFVKSNGHITRAMIAAIRNDPKISDTQIADTIRHERSHSYTNQGYVNHATRVLDVRFGDDPAPPLLAARRETLLDRNFAMALDEVLAYGGSGGGQLNPILASQLGAKNILPSLLNALVSHIGDTGAPLGRQELAQLRGAGLEQIENIGALPRIVAECVKQSGTSVEEVCFALLRCGHTGLEEACASFNVRLDEFRFDDAQKLEKELAAALARDSSDTSAVKNIHALLPHAFSAPDLSFPALWENTVNLIESGGRITEGLAAATVLLLLRAGERVHPGDIFAAYGEILELQEATRLRGSSFAPDSAQSKSYSKLLNQLKGAAGLFQELLEPADSIPLP